MKSRKAPIQKRKRRSILLTFLLLLTLPIFVFSLLENKSFDFRNRAFEEIELSEMNPCIITFPNVNPYTIEVDNTVRIQIDALSKDSNIKSINITDGSGNELFNKSYEENSLTRITESFPYTPIVARAYNLTGTLKSLDGKTYGCVISSPYDIQGVKAITTNSKPEFTTTPRASIPSQNIQTGVTYEYTLKAEDIDKDTINYSYSFTTGQTWLKATVIDDGAGGELAIKFRGSTNTPGSYLANVFIHDGYSKHLSSQSWVISVSPKGNDNPTVTIIEPESPVTIRNETSLSVSWEAVDSNPIIRYELYISSNPVNELAWQEINKNIPPTQSSYTVDLSTITDGTYRIILRAVDNQSPAGIGMDVSPEILISRQEKDPNDPDDSPKLPEPQIINMSPTSNDSISNTNPTIKASLIATENSLIDESSIVVKLDNGDITKEIKINKISESEYTVIYIPENSLTTGLHKVYIYFKDSNGKEAEKEWTFNIGTEEDDDADKFNIFGFEISKRTAYIIGGGIGLIALAIVIPMVIMTIWKDKSEEISTNTALPQSLPKTEDIPIVNPPIGIQGLVKESFQAPEPEIPIEEATTVFEAPEPEEDLTNLYKELKDLEEKEENK